MVIKLDPLLTPSENANRYFAKYNKAKRTRSRPLSRKSRRRKNCAT